MAAITTSYDVYSGDESELAVSITTTQTSGIKISAINQNNSTTSFLNTAGVIEVEQSIDNTRFVEWIAYGSMTINADNTVTLTDVSRDVSRSGSSLTGSGTGQRFIKGAKVRFVVHHFLLNKKANLDRANTWASAQTFAAGGSITPTNTTTPVYHGQSLTTTERDALTGVVDGDWIYNETLNQTQWYEGGSWVSNAAAGSVADGSTTVAGKYEEATVAEQGTATATGGTGARLVPAVANLVKTSSGAGDANKIPVLGASGTLPVGMLGTGTPTAAKSLLGDGTWGSPALFYGFFGTGVDGAVTWSTSTNLNPASNFNYTTSTLNAGQTLSVTSVNTPLYIKSSGDVTINGTIDLNSKGGAGGASVSSATSGNGGTAGATPLSLYTISAGGGGAYLDGSHASGGGGGGASFITGGTAGGTASGSGGAGGGAGAVLSALGFSHLAQFSQQVGCGSGGGSGGASNGAGTGQGGAGGGALLWYIGGNLTLGAASVIQCIGADGTAGGNSGSSYGNGGAGGGGGGCVVIIVAGTVTNSGATLTTAASSGGAGGTAAVTNGAAGGAGAAGKVIIFSLKTGTFITG